MEKKVSRWAQIPGPSSQAETNKWLDLTWDKGTKCFHRYDQKAFWVYKKHLFQPQFNSRTNKFLFHLNNESFCLRNFIHAFDHVWLLPKFQTWIKVKYEVKLTPAVFSTPFGKRGRSILFLSIFIHNRKAKKILLL